MTRFAPALILAAILATAAAIPAPGALVRGDEVPPAIAAAALTYSSALVKADMTTAWNLLSSKSRAEITAVEWEKSLRSRPSSRPPSAQSLLKALVGSEQQLQTGEMLVTPDQALVQVTETVRITQELILVKEQDRWLVDLSASDELNARAAAQLFLDAVAADIKGASARRPIRSLSSSLPTLQALLAPQAKKYHVLQADIERGRARVTLACDVPVSVVLRATRLGPGWVVDLSRPIVTLDPMSADPLRKAMDSTYKSTCQAQLRQLSTVFQMYVAASDDLLPDPSRWVELIRPFAPEDTVLHCPADLAAGITYAMNRNLAGKKRSQIANPSFTPLLFESTLHTDTPSDTGESWPEPALHSDGNLVLYVDGSIRPVKRRPSFAVKEREGGTTVPAQTAPKGRPPRRRPGRAP